MQKRNSIILLVVIALILAGFYYYEKNNNQNNLPKIEDEEYQDTLINLNDNQNNMQATLKTNKGEIVITFFNEDAPKTVENFITLANKNFYDGVIFHRVINGFMIQGGDPTGTGAGGPGYAFEDELNPETESFKRGYLRGTVAMANAGPNTNGSQFFIMHQDYPLPNAYTIFGQVISGIEIVDEIANSETDGRDKPLEDIIIESVVITENN